MSACNQCGREGMKLKCSRCKIAHYCDRKCQEQDWRKHKAGCRKAPEPAAGAVQMGENILLREVETSRDSTFKSIPLPEMFPVQLRDFEYGSSPDGVDENLLILLHGRGDSHEAFATFAQKLKLPQTAYLTLSGPIKLPEAIIKGRLWFEVYDESWDELRHGDIRKADSLEATQRLVEEIIEALCSRCRWQRSRIFLLGYGDGGTVVVAQALSCCGQDRLGGVISISGPLLSEHTVEGNLNPPPLACKKDCTPVLITYGTKACRQHQLSIGRSKRCLDAWHRHPQARVVGVVKDEEMVKTPEEAKVVHQFFADHLCRRMINMESNSTLYEVKRS